jgi:hypothetical protein
VGGECKGFAKSPLFGKIDSFRNAVWEGNGSMIRDRRQVRCMLIWVLGSIAAVCASGLSRMACASDIERFADVKTSEDEALRIIERVRRTAPTKDEAAVWARVANSKKYSDVRRRRAVLQFFDRHVRPGMKLGDVAALLAGPSWLKRAQVHVEGMLRGLGWVNSIVDETIFHLRIDVPSKDESAIILRVGDRVTTEDSLYDTLQGKKTDAMNVRITAIAIDAAAPEDRALVMTRAREWPGSRRGPKQREIVFAEGDMDLYARQLDFFGIELGVLSPYNKIVYAFHLSKPKPDTRVLADPALKEKRYYLTRRNSRQADEKLLSRAGIEVGDRVILTFLPPAIETQLSDLENGYPGADLKKKLKKTRFGVRAMENGFSLFVLEQVQE